MKIDIIDLTSNKVTSQTIDLSLEIDKLYDGYEYINFSKPIILKGGLSLVEDIIYLDAQLSTEFILTCARCLESFTFPLEIGIKERFSRKKENEDDEVILIESDKLDITDIIENNIFISLPLTRLCKEDCKGLCQVCGNDLNKSICNCTNDDVDPRLAKLKDLFSAD